MAITCRVSFRTPWNATSRTLKMPCDSTSWTGTQVANHSWPLRSPSHKQDPRRRNAPMSQVLRAAPLMLSERSNILTSTEKPTTSKADPPRPRPHRTQAGNPGSRVTFARNMESSPHWRFLQFPVARCGCCHSGISSGLAKHKSRVLSLLTGDAKNTQKCYIFVPRENTAPCHKVPCHAMPKLL